MSATRTREFADCEGEACEAAVLEFLDALAGG
jgi:hypothetical protein